MSIKHIQKMEILGYRGFKERATIDFAIPNGEPGSGLTIITGPNNSGKSSIIECLKARSGYNSPSFTSGTRNASIEEVDIKYIIAGKEESIKSIKKGSSETIREGKDEEYEIFILPSRRMFNPYFAKSEFNRKDHLTNTSLPHQRTSTLSNFEYRLFNIIKEPTEFNNILSEVLTYMPEWSIDLSDQGSYFLKFFNGNAGHSSDGMGEGIVSIFAIVDSLYDSAPGDAIVIDEPELSLHPALQKRLSKLLSKYAQDRQIIIATHSPYFIDLKSLRNGGNIIRVVTGPQGTKVHQASSTTKHSIQRLSEGNIYNPHVFGLDARELFFLEDQIILTEGQEDVLLLPHVAEQAQSEITGSFFGWGAGGADNIKHLCTILSDLGYQKVAAILDNDKDALRTSLADDFPDFHFACIPAKDIRTKKARKATEEVNGLLNKELNLKHEYLDEVRKLFNELSQHMRF
ncbi:MAG: ATP-dependent nuclease [Vogesella sp.]|uniref:ATP-dependent nuclease n=1 Tax=Vogesella sp. TaxID=1904252 RepID=UPI00391DE4EA